MSFAGRWEIEVCRACGWRVDDCDECGCADDEAQEGTREDIEVVPASQIEGAVKDERERIANMLARDADSDERGGFDERTRTVLRSYARTIAGGQSTALPLPRTDQTKEDR